LGDRNPRNPLPMKSAFEVLGAVLEMPSGGAYDTLPGYVDGSARYLNFSGKAIFWDAPDASVTRRLTLENIRVTYTRSRGDGR
jgi:hypothetical protein